ncbi:MAG: hypothetical protein NTY12_00765 [Candidatus Falkowbacteria bacterium]|nr:hypothetical protein [Candidatus Falkowbacteria bacterium]
MDDLLKRYYLFSVKNSFSLLIFLFSCCVGGTIFAGFCMFGVADVSNYSHDIFYFFVIVLVLLALGYINGIFVSSGVKKYISMPSNRYQLESSRCLEKDESAYQIIVFEDGTVKYLYEPVLSKGKIHLITLKTDEVEGLEDCESGKFSLSFTYSIRIKFDNYVLVPRFRIRFYFIDDPDPKELYNKIIENNERSINDYLLKEFQLINNFSESVKSSIKYLADELIADKISKQSFIKGIKLHIDFPKNLLSAIYKCDFVEKDEDVFIDT